MSITSQPTELQRADDDAVEHRAGHPAVAPHDDLPRASLGQRPRAERRRVPRHDLGGERLARPGRGCPRRSPSTPRTLRHDSSVRVVSRGEFASCDRSTSSPEASPRHLDDQADGPARAHAGRNFSACSRVPPRAPSHPLADSVLWLPRPDSPCGSRWPRSPARPSCSRSPSCSSRRTPACAARSRAPRASGWSTRPRHGARHPRRFVTSSGTHARDLIRRARVDNAACPRRRQRSARDRAHRARLRGPLSSRRRTATASMVPDGAMDAPGGLAESGRRGPRRRRPASTTSGSTARSAPPRRSSPISTSSVRSSSPAAPTA